MDSHDLGPMHTSPRCTAHSKRTGLPCGSPAVTGWSVCRMHGAGGGAPTGRRNGNYRDGLRTTEAMSRRAEVQSILRGSRALLKQID